MAKDILNMATFGLAGAALKPFGSSTPAATPAATPGPIVMPIADDAKVQAARKRSIAAQMQRSGRASTILTDHSDTLGGG